jgi:hypothetical protein
MKKYWLINVSGHNGYSMLVHCVADDIDEAIAKASEADLFEDTADAKIAFGEEITDDYTIKSFDVNEI